MRIKLSLLIFLLNTFVVGNSSAQKIPLVYDVENTGASFPKPILPDLSKLPAIEPLTDPIEWSDGNFYTIKADKFSASRKMIVQGK